LLSIDFANSLLISTTQRNSTQLSTKVNANQSGPSLKTFSTMPLFATNQMKCNKDNQTKCTTNGKMEK